MRLLLRALPLLLLSLAVHAAEVDRRIAVTIDDLPWARLDQIVPPDLQARHEALMAQLREVGIGCVQGYAVHVTLTGLRPGPEYFYRFRALGHLSRVGRTVTAPARGSNPSRLTMTVASCANWEHGYFTAYRRLAEIVTSLPPSEQATVARGLHLGVAMNEYADEHGRGDFLIRGVLGADESAGAVVVGDLRPGGPGGLRRCASLGARVAGDGP